MTLAFHFRHCTCVTFDAAAYFYNDRTRSVENPDRIINTRVQILSCGVYLLFAGVLGNVNSPSFTYLVTSDQET